MHLTLIAGARPNFMKIAPIMHALQKAKNNGLDISFRLVHTGQHYDEKLSRSFFRDLNIPEPDVNLEVGSGSQATQTANIMVKFEDELTKNPADFVLVVGDVNSTMACAIVAKKLNAKVIHVEAGIRSNDLRMPEEINRMVTDAITDVFFTTTPEAGYNLVKNGIRASQIFLVGNTMIDSLVANLEKLQKPDFYNDLGLSNQNFIVMTLHRPSNVDEEGQLFKLIQLIGNKCRQKQIIFPVHPRTRQNLNKIADLPSNIYLTDPMRYLEFMYLIKDAYAVVTDSGGIQEETTFLGIPCLTLRENTERPETVTLGTNELIGLDRNNIEEAFERLHDGNWKKGIIPQLWDGKTAERIVDALLKF